MVSSCSNFGIGVSENAFEMINRTETFDRMLEAASSALGSDRQAVIALNAAGIPDLLDRVCELEQREHFAITKDLHNRDARRIMRQIVGELTLYFSPAASLDQKAALEHSMRLTLRRVNRAFGPMTR